MSQHKSNAETVKPKQAHIKSGSNKVVENNEEYSNNMNIFKEVQKLKDSEDKVNYNDNASRIYRSNFMLPIFKSLGTKHLTIFNPEETIDQDMTRIIRKESGCSCGSQDLNDEESDNIKDDILSEENEKIKDQFNKSDEVGSILSNNDNKFVQLKQLFRGKSTSHREHIESNQDTNCDNSLDNGLKSLSYKEGEEGDEEGGFFSKLMNISGGGLVPSFGSPEINENRDIENLGQSNNVENDIPMTNIGNTAHKIVQAHSGIYDDHYDHSLINKDDNPDSNNSMLFDDRISNNKDNSAFYTQTVNYYEDMNENHEDMYPLLQNESYIAPPKKVRGGVLGSLLKLYQNPEGRLDQSQISLSDQQTMVDPVLSNSDLPIGDVKKKKKITFAPPSFSHKRSKSSTTLKNLINDSNVIRSDLPEFKPTRSKGKTRNPATKMKRKAAEARITIHIAHLLQRQRFILRMCRGLMMYGAPTHRLEEYMIMTSRVLEIDGQFLYIPGCMIISFGDSTTRTSEVQLIRCDQGLNLWKLHQVHSIYKQVVHDIISVEDANSSIDKILQDKNLYPPWMSVLLYGFCASMVAPYAFGGDWINLAICFLVGSCVGFMKFIVSQRSSLYSNVFEITASIVVSFCGRALGSIPNSNICFAAVVQGSLALILPGYIILCGSLELQSRNLVAGAVRMFYAIIYSLFLGFGITLGAALFGWIYHDATNETTCSKVISPMFRIIFVPFFSIGLSLINQAKWTQLPVMVFISCTGYLVTYWSGKHFYNSTEFTSALAAFVIGIMGNLYSRIWKGLAVSAMLPGIFVQVPSGVASHSSLLSGIQSANQIVHNSTQVIETTDLSSSMSFGITMIQVSIGISVGLFASTLFVYPFGKKRTGLFTL